jgi:hypothetical protein
VDTCLDDIIKLACDEIAAAVPGATNEFVLGSSCSNSFPQHVYLPDIDPDPILRNFCSSNGLSNCGTCAISAPITDNAKLKLKGADNTLIVNKVYKDILKSLNDLHRVK